MMSSNGNIFRVTGHLCGEFTALRWIPSTKHKGQWREALVSSLICAWINCWVNNREAGDLSRDRAHYDVIVKCCSHLLPATEWRIYSVIRIIIVSVACWVPSRYPKQCWLIVNWAIGNNICSDFIQNAKMFFAKYRLQNCSHFFYRCVINWKFSNYTRPRRFFSSTVDRLL